MSHVLSPYDGIVEIMSGFQQKAPEAGPDDWWTYMEEVCRDVQSGRGLLQELLKLMHCYAFPGSFNTFVVPCATLSRQVYDFESQYEQFVGKEE